MCALDDASSESSRSTRVQWLVIVLLSAARRSVLSDTSIHRGRSRQSQRPALTFPVDAIRSYISSSDFLLFITAPFVQRSRDRIVSSSTCATINAFHDARTTYFVQLNHLLARAQSILLSLSSTIYALWAAAELSDFESIQGLSLGSISDESEERTSACRHIWNYDICKRKYHEVRRKDKEEKQS